MPKELSWQPVHRGRIYCAPACGRGCLHSEYLTARRKARLLCRKLGRGWQPRVWENLGWHYEAISPCERLRVDESKNFGTGPRSYMAMLCDKGEAGGRYTAHADTPAGAVAAVIKEAKADLAKIGARLRGL